MVAVTGVASMVHGDEAVDELTLLLAKYLEPDAVEIASRRWARAGIRWSSGSVRPDWCGDPPEPTRAAGIAADQATMRRPVSVSKRWMPDGRSRAATD